MASGRRQRWVEATPARAEVEEALVSEAASKEVSAVVVAVAAGLQARGESDSRWLERGVLTRFRELVLPRLVDASAERLSGWLAGRDDFPQAPDRPYCPDR
ncbi:hypothetical protein [Streptomyces gilvus]|uniref:hypothetical protein n=1 Tax=Streptomyces gilvus TaxID=2920937 RepID=UPI001F0F3EB6|nr:hypothetical protein [Streptomyces sp. CME 23]MCH5671497.1 hypothetical protein [Streptomyces sp. CME 23]